MSGRSAAPLEGAATVVSCLIAGSTALHCALFILSTVTLRPDAISFMPFVPGIMVQAIMASGWRLRWQPFSVNRRASNAGSQGRPVLPKSISDSGSLRIRILLRNQRRETVLRNRPFHNHSLRERG
jgi:hypothetical protein